MARTLRAIIAALLLGSCTASQGVADEATADELVAKLEEDLGGATSNDIRRDRFILFDGTFCMVWENREPEFSSQPPNRVFRSFFNPEAGAGGTVVALEKEMAEGGQITLKRLGDDVSYQVSVGGLAREGTVHTEAIFDRLHQCMIKPRGS